MRNTTLVRWLAAMLVGLLPILAAQAQGAPSCLRYDQIQQRLIHNAYSGTASQKDEQLLDQLIYHRIRAVELDLMPKGFSCLTGSPPEGPPNWYIFHDCTIGQTQTTVNTLGDALNLFKAFHDAQPQHEVVTVYLELPSKEGRKGPYSEFGTYSPDDLDGLLRDRLGSALFTPASLLAWGGERADATGSLHRVVSTRGWPTTDDLRGKFIFILHGHEDDKAQYFGTYPEPDLCMIYRRVAFYLDNNEFWTKPDFIGNPTPWAIFHSEPNAEQAQQMRRDLPGHVLRTSEVNEAEVVAEVQRGGAQLINTDKMDVDEHEFIRFYNDRLYPFGASVLQADGTYAEGTGAWTHPAVAGKAEPGSLFVLGDKSGGGISGEFDRFIFAPLITPPSGQEEVWTAEIGSASNRRVFSGSTGFLMARASDAHNAPHCSVGRAADDEGVWMEYRSDYGLGTASTRLTDSRFRENYNFVKMIISPYDGGGSTLCRGFGSLDGQSWEQIGEDVNFPGIRLTQLGLAVSGNSDPFFDLPPTSYVKIAFVNLQRSVGGLPPEPIDLNLFRVVGIGDVEEPFVQRISQPAITCTDLVAANEPGTCGAHVNLHSAISDHCGTVSFSAALDQLFPVGVTRVQATTLGGASCAFNVTVRDTQKPVVVAAVATPVLSRIGRELVNVGLTASVTDNCPGVSSAQVAVHSDERDTEGGSNFSPDAKDFVPGALRLREEREAQGDGRVYLILLKVADTTGNVGFASRTVVLPRNQSQAAADAVNAQATAAQAYLDANAVPPPGFFAVGGGPVLGPKQ